MRGGDSSKSDEKKLRIKVSLYNGFARGRERERKLEEGAFGSVASK